MKLTIIGRVRSTWKESKGTPIQPTVSHGRARVEIDSPYREALEDLEGFDRIWIVTWMHRAIDFNCKVVPYRDTVERGLFSTRAPSRPNPIGLSCVIVSAVDPHSGIIQTGPLDLLDGTPVLDVKPYMPSFDAFTDAAAGWMDSAKERREISDGRFRGAMTALDAVFLVAGGLVAGFVNTLAGGGSVITIPILIEVVGLPANVANGTNRVAILLQNIVGVATFQRGKVIPWPTVRRVIPWVLVGAAAGAWVATKPSAEAMRKIFAVVIVLVALSAVLRPKRWLGGHEDSLATPWREIAFLAIGFYGGFVQAGVGFLLLAGLVLGGGLDLVRGNAAKVAVVLLYTSVSLAIFLYSGHVVLLAGAVLGVGNATGAFIAARLAIRKGAGWIRWVLLVAAVGAAARMLLS